MNRLTLSFPTTVPPKCPLCLKHLQAEAISVRNDIAWCGECLPMVPYVTLLDVDLALRAASSASQTQTVHGVLFYCPQGPLAGRLAAHLRIRVLRDPTLLDEFAHLDPAPLPPVVLGPQGLPPGHPAGGPVEGP